MVLRKPADDRGATYEIRLAGAPPESLRRRFPSMRIQALRAQTVLFRRSAGFRSTMARSLRDHGAERVTRAG